MFSSFFKKFLKTKNRKPKASEGFTQWNTANYSIGFTLLELIVVIAIFLIITAVVMTDIPNFREKSSLDLTVSEVATYIRGAQVYGTAKLVGTGGGYGVRLSSGSPSFYLFQGSNPDTSFESYELKGFKIGQLNDDDCSSVDIVYPGGDYRTSFESNLIPQFSGEGTSCRLTDFVKIEIVSQRGSGSSKCVFVYKNGQITIGACD
ncbi:MAG: type II secretion system protein [Candidatus Paceibacterota bacterium]|jgi:prepilin-type N-terminal cleavage/methylation domain-containing protein